MRSLRIAPLVLAVPCALASAQGTRLLRSPTISKDQVAFTYAGDLWLVPRAGGTARRLTSTPTAEYEPHFSPDGSMIAYSATVGGNRDVYVIPTRGGESKRLTYHPDIDAVRGWTPDGKRIVFASGRTSAPTAYPKLWSIGVDDGLPQALPMPRAYSGSFSPDGKQIAYEEISTALVANWAFENMSYWRHYRGGRTHPIQIMTLAGYTTEHLPWTNSNDTYPMWVGGTVYFLSDRDGTVNLFSWKPGAKTVTQLTHHDDFDIMNASAGPDAIVYEQAGYIHVFDIASGRSHQLNIEVDGDLPWTRAQLKAAAVRSSAIAPNGSRVAFEARGDIFVVPADRPDARNLTQTPGVHDRNPSWSPDGAQLAWLSDATGEYQLVLGEPSAFAKPKTVALPSNAYFDIIDWSPDGKQILLDDNHLAFWTFDVASSRFTKIATDMWDDISREVEAVWSPDSKWIAFSGTLDNHLRAIFVHSLVTGKTTRVTDGLADASSPAFDAGGKYLYFLASTNDGLGTASLDMSSIDRPATRAIYLAVLSANEPSPFLAESEDLNGPAPVQAGRAAGFGAAGGGAAAPVSVRIDFDGISSRVLALSLPAGEYRSLKAGPAGSFFFLAPAATGGRGGAARIMRYDVRARSAQPFVDGATSYSVAADHRHVLYAEAGGAGGRGAGRGGAVGPRYAIASVDRPQRGGAGDAAATAAGQLDLSRMETWVDPKAEWADIFRETWRIEREFFYDSLMHGNDWNRIYEKYHPMLSYVGHRDDLGYLIAMVGGELTVGHSYLSSPGELPPDEPVNVGLLGADVAVDNGRYRITKIFSGENWNPELQAPLAAPGIQVAEGDYILEVNGRSIAPPANFYSVFEGTAGSSTVLRVSKSPAGQDSHLVTVTPIANDGALRARAWIEDNRRAVDRLSGGKLAYVWLPNTAAAGYQYFNRYYFAQQDKQGAIIDERYNGGGQIADYIVDELDRKLDGYFARRDGKTRTSPGSGIFGPKVMVINESAGSGGDALPYMFHLRKIGPLVGTRTWGGLVGTLGIPQTLDGGGITAPSLAFYDLHGKWAVENEGIAPDVPVDYTPADVIKGHDPQLERAVQEALKLLETGSVTHTPRPAPINRVGKP